MDWRRNNALVKKRQNSETNKQPVKEKGRSKKLHTGKGNT
jgi:hypothetical protein